MTLDPRSSPSESTVRVSSLCSRPVEDDLGASHGTVLDAYVLRSGPLNVSGDARLRIDGLVVGRAGWFERSGLLRSTVHGPWLLRAIARRIGPRRGYLPWSQVQLPHELGTGGPVRFTGELRELPRRSR